MQIFDRQERSQKQKRILVHVYPGETQAPGLLLHTEPDTYTYTKHLYSSTKKIYNPHLTGVEVSYMRTGEQLAKTNFDEILDVTADVCFSKF